MHFGMRQKIKKTAPQPLIAIIIALLRAHRDVIVCLPCLVSSDEHYIKVMDEQTRGMSPKREFVYFYSRHPYRSGLLAILGAHQSHFRCLLDGGKTRERGREA